VRAKIHVCGKHDELLAQGGHYAEIYELQLADQERARADQLDKLLAATCEEASGSLMFQDTLMEVSNGIADKLEAKIGRLAELWRMFGPDLEELYQDVLAKYLASEGGDQTRQVRRWYLAVKAVRDNGDLEEQL
jgi:hypothetical protein